MSADDVWPDVLAKLIAVVGDASTQRDLATYFERVDDNPFTDRWFERLGGGGDRLGVENRITATELIAIETLSVQVPSRAARALLEGSLGHRVSTCLAQVPTTVEIGTEQAAPLLSPEGAAWRAWELLDEPKGMGTTTVSKVLAHKRPRLLPVLDEVGLCAVGDPQPRGTWDLFQRVLGDYGIRVRLEELRSLCHLETPDEGPGISLARVFDVVVWMAHRASHQQAGRRCRGLP